LAVNDRVRVYPGTEAETRGVIVEDFGEMAAQAVDIGDNHFADPARRWAVVLESGTLLFADSDQLIRE
jgi:D-lyxose ketol-isomerase